MEHKAIKGHIALFAANILFGLNNPISRSLIPETISPYFLTFCRLVGGMLLFWFFSLFLPKEKVPIKDVILLFFAAIFGCRKINDLFNGRKKGYTAACAGKSLTRQRLGAEAV